MSILNIFVKGSEKWQQAWMLSFSIFLKRSQHMTRCIIIGYTIADYMMHEIVIATNFQLNFNYHFCIQYDSQLHTYTMLKTN